jgi:hypothetical protein
LAAVVVVVESQTQAQVLKLPVVAQVVAELSS